MDSQSRGSASSLALIAAVVAINLVATPQARGETRVVVMTFKGDGAKRYQGDVVELVRDRYRYISGKRFVRKARDLGFRKASPENLAKTAAELGADALVYGQVSKRRGKTRLRIYVRAGGDGEIVGDPFTVRFRRRFGSKQAKRVERKLEDLINEIEDDGRGQSDGGRERRPRVERGDPDERLVESPDEDPDEEDPEDVGSSLMDSDGRSAALTVRAGLRVIKRSLNFASQGDLGLQAPRGYSGGIMPTGTIDAEMYPFAFDETARGFKRDIGIVANLEHEFLVKSQFPDQPMVTLPTDYFRFGAGIIWRKRFGSTALDPTLKLRAGVNRNTFKIDRGPIMGADIDLPNVRYTYIDPGAQLHYPVSDKVRINALAKGIYVLSTGTLGSMEEYGGSTSFGFEADASVEYSFSPKLSISVGARTTGFRHSFDGSGEEADRNDDGTQDVAGAFDLYLGGYAMAGYVF